MSDITFVLLSFEGPDPYCHAGGLGSRVAELSRDLAAIGFETHLFFVGDPALPGHEMSEAGRLHLHRWCQWISQYHPGGVYDGEEAKLNDWEHSLPGWLESEILALQVAAGNYVVVLAEEWHTAGSLIALHQVVQRRGWQEQVRLLWNANNTFSFYRVPWDGLKNAATITTVSKYMKHVMWSNGVDARVVPNGVPERWLRPTADDAAPGLSGPINGRVSLVKVARWDPDKRWLMAVDAVAQMKDIELRPLLLARGGAERHQVEVLSRAMSLGLLVSSVQWEGADADSVIEAILPAIDSDIIVLDSYLTEPQRRMLFHTSFAVLANSGIEPFGLVGLETMAVGGLAFVGCTGEDYATHGHDSISLQSNDPKEIVHHVSYLREHVPVAARMRQNAMLTATRYTWRSVIQRSLLPLLGELGVPVLPPDLEPVFKVPPLTKGRSGGVD